MDSEDMSPEDRDLIEALWRQDIDMGITREDSFPTKGEMELEKTKPVQEKAPHSDWQYNIDCETGEQLPIPRTGPPTESTQVPSQDVTVPDSRGLSFEDCLNLLDSFNPQVEDPSSSVVPPLVDAVEIEQRWQDLASISELQMSPLLAGNNSVDAAPSRFPNATWNSSIADEQNVFAFNATTNGNVNLQNATSPRCHLFNSTSNKWKPVDCWQSIFKTVNYSRVSTILK
ncbi:putative nuclear factor, erythroid derived 2 isoform X1 [Apostichopus japonicus]|uniref:Putative nuclear factor, erythroid derived 2 isoform X1 n=1 Tax=Stichopus japonicus TaxID=307972 RepID=A0A2G8KR43_STIJA|nr:putative nuclear factor, erythroid derived 2 isoform X1 [Apostichopus japonicus]